CFVTKINANGTAILLSTYIGGTSTDIGQGIAVDTAVPPNIYITGYTNKTAGPATDYPTTAGAFSTVHKGLYDAFVTKLNGAGSTLLWSTFLGGASYDYGRAIAVDTAVPPNVYITGQTNKTALPATDFPTTAGAFDTTHNGLYDAFVTKIAPTGATLVW